MRDPTFLRLPPLAEPCEACKMRITSFQSLHSSYGTTVELTWVQLTEQLSKHQETPWKESVPLWSPLTFGLAESSAPLTKRSGDCVEACSALVFDVDGAVPEQIAAIQVPFLHFAHSTYRNGLKGICMRVIVPLATPLALTSQEARQGYKLALRNAAVLFGVPFDRACLDLARMFFLPSCPTNGRRFAQGGEGPILDLSQLPQVDQRMSTMPSKKLWDLVVEGKAFPEGTRDNSFFQVGRDLRKCWPDITPERLASLFSRTAAASGFDPAKVANMAERAEQSIPLANAPSRSARMQLQVHPTLQ